MQTTEQWISEHPEIEAANKAAELERDLRAKWTKDGISQEIQDAIIAQVTAAAAPGAWVGPFQLSMETPPRPKPKKPEQRDLFGRKYDTKAIEEARAVIKKARTIKI